MQTNTFKLFVQFLAGIFGGTILGLSGFLVMMNYGGIVGCPAFVDSISGTVGYESCGYFGSISGMITGVILAIFIFRRVKTTNDGVAGLVLLFGSFLLPFLFGVIILWPPFEDGDILLVPPVTLMFIIASIMPSAIVVLLIQSWTYIQKRRSTKLHASL